MGGSSKGSYHQDRGGIVRGSPPPRTDRLRDGTTLPPPYSKRDVGSWSDTRVDRPDLPDTPPSHLRPPRPLLAVQEGPEKGPVIGRPVVASTPRRTPTRSTPHPDCPSLLNLLRTRPMSQPHHTETAVCSHILCLRSIHTYTYCTNERRHTSFPVLHSQTPQTCVNRPKLHTAHRLTPRRTHTPWVCTQPR